MGWMRESSVEMHCILGYVSARRLDCHGERMKIPSKRLEGGVIFLPLEGWTQYSGLRCIKYLSDRLIYSFRKAGKWWQRVGLLMFCL